MEMLFVVLEGFVDPVYRYSPAKSRIQVQYLPPLLGITIPLWIQNSCQTPLLRVLNFDASLDEYLVLLHGRNVSLCRDLRFCADRLGAVRV